KPTSGMSAQAQAILDDIAKQPYTKGIKNLDNDFSSKPALKANIDRLAFYALAERDDIRAIRPVNFQDARMAQWPEEVLEAAKEHSDTEIIITLRGGEFFSPKTGYMPAAAIKAQEKAHQRAFDDILSKADLSADTNTSATTHLSLGILHGRFNFESLTKLYDAKDARILSIELNKPVAWTSLTNSTALMNLAPAWNAGYRAAGQSIVIIDSGVRKDHALFTTSGVSRVTFEACFGSNITASNGITYSSICPSQDASGDSPLGFPSSGEPNPNLAVCNTLATMPPPHTHDCSHGTHVAGIAAARKTNSVIPNTLQGVGPDASIISAQVFSYNNSVPSASAFNLDILAALIAVKNNTVVGLNNPFTINMSLGGNFYPNQSACPVTSINTAVTDLLSRGVPVIAATGNDYNKSSIASPACVPGIIKVSAVRNDSTGTTLSSFANIASQTLFPGGPFLFAPGGGDGTGVRSADRVSTTATKLMQGTSQAAPHVAGLYAAVKAANPGGVSVADVTAWIVTTGSIPVTINLPSIGNQTFRRVRAPN
ncbi:MAG: S8 family serine peptidase, partial [Betaproteobacteria bacterium]|nr:S8 family serine peptidase [Betaproteobacteria bacterium]